VVMWLAAIGSPVDALSCTKAIMRLLPCQPYLTSLGDISAPCCEAAQSLNQIAAFKPNLKSLCECFKKVIPALGVNIQRAKQIPQLCNIIAPLPIDPNVNCDNLVFNLPLIKRSIWFSTYLQPPSSVVDYLVLYLAVQT
jgi:hypothetical protein